MSIVFFLIPLGLVLVAIAVWAFVWAVNHDQFEDLDKAAHSILYDDDEAPAARNAPTADPESRHGGGLEEPGEEAKRDGPEARRDGEA